MMFIINCPRPSKSANRLTRKLKGKRYQKIKTLSSGDTIINWGDSDLIVPRVMHLGVPECEVLNLPEAIRLVANKRLAFDAFSSAGVPIPHYAKTKADVTWKGSTVVRNKLTGHSGEGIEIHDDISNLPDAPLYVEYIKKQDEYRIHVGKKDDTYVIIAKQRKARNLSIPNEEVDWQVRSHDNGFVFVRQDCNPPDCVSTVACAALAATGLDFGAVDVIFNVKENRAYVLEINTAPGLEGQTVEDYAAFFRSLVN